MQTSLRTLFIGLAVGAVVLMAGARDGSAAGEPSCAILPGDNPWNTDISAFPVHAQSDAFVDAIGRYQDLHPDFGTVWNGHRSGFRT
jgi:hypothetical protein